jgi:hypothetical protein
VLSFFQYTPVLRLFSGIPVFKFSLFGVQHGRRTRRRQGGGSGEVGCVSRRSDKEFNKKELHGLACNFNQCASAAASSLPQCGSKLPSNPYLLGSAPSHGRQGDPSNYFHRRYRCAPTNQTQLPSTLHSSSASLLFVACLSEAHIANRRHRRPPLFRSLRARQHSPAHHSSSWWLRCRCIKLYPLKTSTCTSLHMSNNSNPCPLQASSASCRCTR